MKKLIVYTKEGCNYCLMAKDHLKKLQLEYVEINITKDESAREKLIADGHKTLPVIYAEDSLLVPGGYNTLKTMRKEDILERLK